MARTAQRVAGLAAVALLAIAAGCSTSSPQPASSRNIPVPEGGYGVMLAVEGPTGAEADTLRMTLVVFNRSATDLAFQFSSGQRYDFAIIDSTGSEVWRWSEGQLFTQALGSETVAPGGELRYAATYVGELPAGGYRVVGEVTARESSHMATAVISGQ